MIVIALLLRVCHCSARCALVVYTLTCRGADWFIEPAASLRGEYTDNLTRSPGFHSTVWAAVFSSEVKFGRTTETLEVKGGLKANVNQYSDSELDTEDYFATATSKLNDPRQSRGFIG